MSVPADFRITLQTLLDGQDLAAATMQAAMDAIFGGEWTPAQISGFLVALRAKGETPDEIVAAAKVMRSKATPVEGLDPTKLVDVVGTGGDGRKTFNISTAAAFIAAAAGVSVAKHCNRALSSASGSSDVLAASGIDISVKSPEEIASMIRDVGIGFMFAPNHHSAMKHAAPVRKELGVRTIFNVLGPLTNPASVARQVTGVFTPDLVEVYAAALRDLGSSGALIVHGDGIDEITVTGATTVAELKQDGNIEQYELKPEDFSFTRHPLESIQVNSPEQSKEMVDSVFAGEKGPCREAALMTAGAAIYLADLADSIRGGVDLAAKTVDEGKAKDKFDEFAAQFAPAAGS